MIISLLAHLLFVVFLAHKAIQRRKHTNWLFLFLGVVVLALGVEIVRELRRLGGVPLSITPVREMWYRFVYFSFGLYYNEVLHYVRKVTKSES